VPAGIVFQTNYAGPIPVRPSTSGQKWKPIPAYSPVYGTETLVENLASRGGRRRAPDVIDRPALGRPLALLSRDHKLYARRERTWRETRQYWWCLSACSMDNL